MDKTLTNGEVPNESYYIKKTKANTITQEKPLQMDHIPSNVAVRKYLEKTLNIKLIGREKDRIAENFTTIAIPVRIHEQSATFKTRNNPDRTNADSDNYENLIIATIRDIQNEAVTIKDQISDKAYAYYFYSAGILVSRNAELCLYSKID